MSVHCCLVVTCWERADLLALFCDVCVFITFPCGILGQVWYLIVHVSIPDLCRLSYFEEYLWSVILLILKGDFNEYICSVIALIQKGAFGEYLWSIIHEALILPYTER